MDKFLGQEISSGEAREQYLQANCFGTEEKGYMKQFTPEELAEMKSALAELSIKINDIETEKKLVVDEFKERLKPLGNAFGETLTNIKNKAEYVTENTYKFLYEDERMVGYFSKDGVLVEARPMRPEEMQRDMFLPMTGTNK